MGHAEETRPVSLQVSLGDSARDFGGLRLVVPGQDEGKTRVEIGIMDYSLGAMYYVVVDGAGYEAEAETGG